MCLFRGQWTGSTPYLPPPAAPEAQGEEEANDHKVLEGILWVLKTGPRWGDPAGMMLPHDPDLGTGPLVACPSGDVEHTNVERR